MLRPTHGDSHRKDWARRIEVYTSLMDCGSLVKMIVWVRYVILYRNLLVRKSCNARQDLEPALAFAAWGSNWSVKANWMWLDTT